MALPTYIPIEEAAQRFGLEVAQLRLLAESGKIEAAQLPDGDVMVKEDELKDTGELPRYIPLAEAVERYGLDTSRVTRLIEEEKLTAVTTPDGDILVDERQIEILTLGKESLPEYKKHAHLKGTSIWLSAAERKYNIPGPTISRWVKAGIIKKLGKDGNKVLLDEADIAYCAEVYRTKNAKRGRKLFDSRGMPYQTKTPKVV